MSTPQKRSPSPGLGRSSFSSIRERDSDYAQTFTLSKVSSYNHLAARSKKDASHSPPRQQTDEIAVADEPSSSSSSCLCTSSSPSPASPASPVLPASNMLLSTTPLNAPALDRSLLWLHDVQYDDGCQDSTKRQDSLLDISRTQVDGWYAHVDDADTAMETVEDVRREDPKQPLECLPVEIFNLILNHLVLDTPPNGIDRRNVDLMSLLVTSRRIYDMTIETVYRRVVVPHSRIFQKFRSQIDSDPIRGTWVRRLDFSHFNPVSLFTTASQRQAARNLTSETLLRCLDLTPNLHEFLIQDYIDGDLNEDVLRKLLTGLPYLKALDLCGCSSLTFRSRFTSLVANAEASETWPTSLGIQRLSLHKCMTLPSSVFEFLLPSLHHLTHLDVAGTRITDAALHSIPTTARITHLNLAKCSLLTSDAVIDFLTNHPAVNHNSLVFLSLSFDATTSQLLDKEDVSRLLPILPRSLKSLSLKGSKMDRSHLPQLRVLSKHLEELALGCGFSLSDVNALVVPPPTVSASDSASGELGSNSNTPEGEDGWVPHSLRYIDLSDMTADSLDLSYLYLDSQILNSVTTPLEVIEVADDVFKRISKSKGPLIRMGWRQSEIGSRSWLVRDSHPASNIAAITTGKFAMENGSRPWKMGAQSWGMRKIPVAEAKVGGMYGSYMFGRKL